MQCSQLDLSVGVCNYWLWVSFRVFNGSFCWSKLSLNFEKVLSDKFFINIIDLDNLSFPFYEYLFIYVSFLHYLSIQSLSFFPWNIICFSIFRNLIKQISNFIILRDPKVTTYRWFLSIKPEPVQLHDKMVLPGRKAVTAWLKHIH